MSGPRAGAGSSPTSIRERSGSARRSSCSTGCKRSRGCCLNASLTITRYLAGGAPEQLFGHIPLWAPVVGHALTGAAKRPTGHVVFLLLGTPAHLLSDTMGIRQAAESVGAWGSRVNEVRLAHPASNNFLRSKNPFLEVNARLSEMGGQPIDW
jgi:hypothetical protein